MLLATVARRPLFAPRPETTKPIVLLEGDDSPARVITACIRAMLRTRLPLPRVTRFMADADRTESFAELAQVCSEYVVLRDA